MISNFFSWGNYPKIKCKVIDFQDVQKTKNFFSEGKNYIPRGNGRSYGDSSLSKEIIDMRSHNRILNFNKKNGISHIQSGILISDIIEKFLPLGWFLKVTPGTKFITIGGAIASDIHGKNHHRDGCFSESIEEFKIMLPNGKIKTSSKKVNTKLFESTCGGMGLTGIILEAKISLQKVTSMNIDQMVFKTSNLKETFDIFEKNYDKKYSVAWIDCLANAENLGRGIINVGDFSNDGNLDYKPKRKINVPNFFPSFLINKYTVKIFNSIYYFLNSQSNEYRTVSLDSFFYPLDSLNNWNNIYGRKGFIQYQFILPKKNSYEGMKDILETVLSSGKGSFLSVLKLHGKSNDNYLSFPMEGYSLALDFKIEKGIFELLKILDKKVVKYNGRIYLTKDARVTKDIFEKGYPQIEKFRSYRKNQGFINVLNSFQSRRLKI